MILAIFSLCIVDFIALLFFGFRLTTVKETLGIIYCGIHGLSLLYTCLTFHNLWYKKADTYYFSRQLDTIEFKYIGLFSSLLAFITNFMVLSMVIGNAITQNASVITILMRSSIYTLIIITYGYKVDYWHSQLIK